MYNTTSQFIANARALKTALLTCLLVNESLRIETGSAGAVPCVLDKPNRIILNGNYAMQMVPADAPEPAERFLARQVIGNRIQVITNYDSPEAQAKAVRRECVIRQAAAQGRLATDCAKRVWSPLRVKGGCRRQVDGTAGLPSARRHARSRRCSGGRSPCTG